MTRKTTTAVKHFFEDSGYFNCFEFCGIVKCPNINTDKGRFQWMRIMGISLDYQGDGSWNVMDEYHKKTLYDSQGDEFDPAKAITKAVIMAAEKWLKE